MKTSLQLRAVPFPLVIALLIGFAAEMAEGRTIIQPGSNQPPWSLAVGVQVPPFGKLPVILEMPTRPANALAIEGFPIESVCVVMPRTNASPPTKLELYAYSPAHKRWLEVKPPIPLTRQTVRAALAASEAASPPPPIPPIAWASRQAVA